MYGPGAADGLRRPAHRAPHIRGGSSSPRRPYRSAWPNWLRTTDGHLGNPNGWEAVGYDSRHTSIEGFANFHEFQVGGVVVAPTVGELQTVPGPLDNPDAGYRSRFDKKDEVARPRLLLRAAEGLRRQGRADGHRTGRVPPLYLPGDGGGEPDLQHRDAHGRKRPGARRVGDLHRRRTYRGLGGDRARLCRHLPERRHGDNVFQRRTRRRACGLGRVQRRANLRGGAQPHQAPEQGSTCVSTPASVSRWG